MERHRITIYCGARDPKPADAQDLTWAEIADTLELEANRPTSAPATADIEEQKKCMLAWSPHALLPGATRRAADTVEAVTLLVVDVDNNPPAPLREGYVPVAPEDVVEMLRLNGAAGVVYESPSASEGNPRFRIVCPITEPIPPEHCYATRYAFAQALGLQPGCGVEGAIDASKLFFIGCAHDTPPRRAWRVEGNPVDAAALPPAAAAWGKGKAAAGAVAGPLRELPPANAGIAAALGPWTEHDGRKWSLCGAVAGVMRRMGYGPGACEAALREWLPVDEPHVNVDAAVRWAMGAWTEKPDKVSGIDFLGEIVGEAHATVIADAIQAGGRWQAARPLVSGGGMAGSTRWSTGSADGDPLGVRVSWDDDDEPIPYLCEGLRLAPSQGKISLIGGLPGAGKGPLADYLAVCFALGLDAFGKWPCQKVPVLLLDCEGARLTKRRVRRICRALGHDPRELAGCLDVRDMTAKEVLSDRVLQAIQAHEARAIFLDSYSSAMLPTGLDSNKPEFAQLAGMLGTLDRLVIAVAHARKPASSERAERPTLADVMGSGILGSMAATGLSVWKPDNENDLSVRVACMRAPELPFATFDAEFADTSNDGLAVRLGTAKETDPAAEYARELSLKAGWIVERLRAVAPRPQTINALKSVGVGAALLERILGALERAGIVQYEPMSGAKAAYTLIDAQGPTFDVDFGLDGVATRVPRVADQASVGGFRR